MPFIRKINDTDKNNKSGSDIDKQIDTNYSKEDDKFNFDNSNELALTTGPSSTENKARLKNRFASKKNRMTVEAKGIRRLESSGIIKTSPKNEENK